MKLAHVGVEICVHRRLIHDDERKRDIAIAEAVRAVVIGVIMLYLQEFSKRPRKC